MRQKLLYFLMFLIFCTSIYLAKNIGDKATKFQIYKALQSVVKLSQPAHATINELQKERALSSIYLSNKELLSLDLLQEQFKTSDTWLNNLAASLKATEILLLSIPSSELPKMTAKILDNRVKIESEQFKFSENFHFYNDTVARLSSFLEKMYTYSDDPEFAPLITALTDSDFVKESLSKEGAYVSYYLSLQNIPLGENLIIRQMILDHLALEEKLDQTIDRDIKIQLTKLYASPERSALTAQRAQFDQKEPIAHGSAHLGRAYLDASLTYVKKLYEVDISILKRLEDIARNGCEKLKNDIIWTSISGLLTLLILVGAYFLLQKKTPIT